MAKKVKILGATANDCEFCKGIIYKIELNKCKTFYQCKDCGNTYEKGKF